MLSHRQENYEAQALSFETLAGASSSESDRKSSQRFQVLSNRLEMTRFRHGRACVGHPRLSGLIGARTWMPGTRPGMTRRKRLISLVAFFESDSQDEETKLVMTQ
jgi:hypothetical protein